jgi:tetratricopeptide (TPR) repeat protein
MDWHAQCLDLAWKRYDQWEKSGPERFAGQLASKAKRITRRTGEKPGYPIRLEKRGRREWEFAWAGDVLKLMDTFNEGRACLATNPDKARHTFNTIIKKCPHFIDAYNQLAVLELDLGNRSQAGLYFQSALEIGRSVMPDNFTGRLPWSWAENRPFLRALYGLSLVLLQEGINNGAKGLLERLLNLDPDDPLGARLLLEDIKKGTVAPDE